MYKRKTTEKYIKSYKILRNASECLKKSGDISLCLKVVEELPYRNGDRLILSSLQYRTK